MDCQDQDKKDEFEQSPWVLTEWCLATGLIVVEGLWITLLVIVGCRLWERASGL